MPIFPTEIWTMIAEELLERHGDLYHLCCVARWTRAIAEPILYRTIPCQCVLCFLLPQSTTRNISPEYYHALECRPSKTEIARWNSIAPHIHTISLLHPRCIHNNVHALFRHEDLKPFRALRSVTPGPRSLNFIAKKLSFAQQLQTLDLSNVESLMSNDVDLFIKDLPKMNLECLSNLHIAVGGRLIPGQFRSSHSLGSVQAATLLSCLPRLRSLCLWQRTQYDSTDPVWHKLPNLTLLDSLIIHLEAHPWHSFTQLTPPLTITRLVVNSSALPSAALCSFIIPLLQSTSRLRELELYALQDEGNVDFIFSSLFPSITVDTVVSTLEYLKLEYQDPTGTVFAQAHLVQDCGRNLAFVSTLTKLVLNAQIPSLEQICGLIEPLSVLEEFDQSCWPLPQFIKMEFASVFNVLAARPTLTKLGLSVDVSPEYTTALIDHPRIANKVVTSLRYRVGWKQHCSHPEHCIETLATLLKVYHVRATVESGTAETDATWSVVNNSV